MRREQEGGGRGDNRIDSSTFHVTHTTAATTVVATITCTNRSDTSNYCLLVLISLLPKDGRMKGRKRVCECVGAKDARSVKAKGAKDEAKGRTDNRKEEGRTDGGRKRREDRRNSR